MKTLKRAFPILSIVLLSILLIFYLLSIKIHPVLKTPATPLGSLSPSPYPSTGTQIINSSQSFLLSTPQGSQWQENYNISLTMASNPGSSSSSDDIRLLFKHWLIQFEAGGVPQDDLLSDFRIVDVIVYPMDVGYLAKAHGMDYVAKVIYSVKPVQTNSMRWAAGDGIPGDGGWINSKIEYVVGKTVGTQDYLIVLGPCPLC